MQLRHKLKLAMETAQVTVDDIAEALGVHRNTVLNYLSGRTKTVPFDHVVIWAHTCDDVPLDWFTASFPTGYLPVLVPA